jgi:hypothetical protein
MGRYLRRLRTELRHRYDEFFEATKGRRECAFEVQLRNRFLEATRDTVALAEACLDELRRQEAMFYAPYKPGDRVLVEYQVEGTKVTRGPYLIIDVCPDKRGGFHYEAAELTKKGTMHARRAPHWLCPRPAMAMRLSDARVCEDAEREAKYFRECAQTSRVLAFERGDLTLFAPIEGYLGSRNFRRKDRMSV